MLGIASAKKIASMDVLKKSDRGAVQRWMEKGENQMTAQEAIAEFKTSYCAERCPALLENNCCYKTECEIYLAIEALEKQIPKKPITRYGVTYFCPPDCGGKDYDEYGDVLICPMCKKDIEVGSMYENYCHKCGQEIDWSEEDV